MSSKNDFIFDVSGSPGYDGYNGTHGERGTKSMFKYHKNGYDGGDAGNPTAGQSGGNLLIRLSTTTASRNNDDEMVADHTIQVTTEGYQSGGIEAYKPDDIYLSPMSTFGTVEWNVKGGNGGDGGIGGSGGDGARGEKGADATSYSRGGNGGTGGDGGRAGAGTSGAPGGEGGTCEIVVDDRDSYLLMAVKGCDAIHGPGNRIEGGHGGRAGMHGLPGQGGPGGAGGRSYSETKTTYFSDGTQTTKHFYMPGGSPGAPGRQGAVPVNVLKDGADGAKGTLQLNVSGTGEPREVFESRYDLALNGVEEHKLSQMISPKGDRMYEFGETVVLKNAYFTNFGAMRTPIQRVMIELDRSRCDKLNVLPDMLFTQSNLRVNGNNGKGVADRGALSFVVCKPATSELREADFEPLRSTCKWAMSAFQLGPELYDQRLQVGSTFSRPYTSFDLTSHKSPIPNAYPVENANGIIALRALAKGQTTKVSIEIKNISMANLGVQAEMPRQVLVSYQLCDDDDHQIGLDNIEFRRCKKKKLINLDPSQETMHWNINGHVHELHTIKPEKSLTMKHILKLRKKVNLFQRVGIQVSLFLQDIPTLTVDEGNTYMETMTLVQRRRLTVSCQPHFRNRSDAKVLIVSSSWSTRAQVRAWVLMIEKRFGLLSDYISIDFSGHLDPLGSIVAVDGSTHILKDVFRDRVIILLNDLFEPLPNKRRKFQCEPSRLLDNIHGFHPSTHWFIVGQNAASIDQLYPCSPRNFGPVVMPRRRQKGNPRGVKRDKTSKDVDSITSTTEIVHSDHQETFHQPSQKFGNRKAFRNFYQDCVDSERRKGSTILDSPGNGIVAVKASFLLKPSAKQMQRSLERRAMKLQTWLKLLDPLRNYLIEIEECKEVSKLADTRMSYKLGTVKIHRGTSRKQENIFITAPSSGCSYQNPETIESISILRGVVSALPLSTKLNCFCACIGKNKDTELEHIVRDDIVSSFLLELSNSYDGRFCLLKMEMSKRSEVLTTLRKHKGIIALIQQSQKDEELRGRVQTSLSDLVGHLRSVAKTKDLAPWWSPLSRKHRIRRGYIQAVRGLKREWADILDKEAVRMSERNVVEQVRRYIHKDRGKWFVRCRRRWLAGLAALHSADANAQSLEQNKSLPAHCHSPSAIHIRSQEDMGHDHETHKIKKCVPTLLTQGEADNWRAITKDENRFLWEVCDTIGEERKRLLVH